VDFFAAYVIPEDEWYLIPAAVLFAAEAEEGVTLLPENPRHPERYRCEGYREASELLLPAKSTTKAWEECAV
jgi:hypothetical protein